MPDKIRDELEDHVQRVAATLRKRARRGTFDGTMAGMPYLDACRLEDDRTGTRLIFTRDVGHHSSGWLKNPDYERCLHLSLSLLPRQIVTLQPVLAELDRKTAALWVRAFFGEHVRYVWAESPKSQPGRAIGVWHWRLFCDERWRPILPRGEVYTTEFTELGWRSASQVLEERTALGNVIVSRTEDGRIIESTVDPT